MTRRNFLSAAAAQAAMSAAPVRSRMGLATTCYMTVRRPRDTYEFLEYADSLGAGGIQANLSSLEPAYLNKVRERAGAAGMYLEVMAGLPKKPEALDAFERTLAAANEVGALCVRTACLSGRRYENFASLAEWQAFVTESKKAIDRAVPVAEKHRIPLALENHKDWTAAELLAIIKERNSPWLGVALDTGNNISLLDDPMELVEMLAPHAVSTHIKDMALESYADGFLLSEMPLGEGMLDMRRIVAAIQNVRPNTRITLEMITRNPLKVPCLTDKYWLTFPQRNGLYLARTLRLAGSSHRNLPTIDQFSRDAQLHVEEDNVKRCIAYAREHLSL